MPGAFPLYGAWITTSSRTSTSESETFSVHIATHQNVPLRKVSDQHVLLCARCFLIRCFLCFCSLHAECFFPVCGASIATTSRSTSTLGSNTFCRGSSIMYITTRQHFFSRSSVSASMHIFCSFLCFAASMPNVSSGVWRMDRDDDFKIDVNFKERRRSDSNSS